MKTCLFSTTLFLALACLVLTGVSEAAAPLDDCRQLVLVTADSWDARAGIMRLYERGEKGPWRQNGAPIKVTLGKNGLAWGRGLYGEAGDAPEDGPMKREGDGKAPAGMFRLGPVFGYAPQATRKLRMAYTQMTDAFECVDDPASGRYNQVLDASGVAQRDWNSSERMHRDDHQYELGVIVAHNAAPAVSGGGSCIFLHVWQKPGAYTSGCTAMSLGDMKRLTAWLDQSKKPVLAQLPENEHAKFRKLYSLP
jgi:D-alanyl-D-alanine dipeptidase